MSICKSALLFITVLLLAPPATFGAGTPETFHPKVLCELKENHGNNSEASFNEVKLIEEALVAIYPELPDDLQAHAREVTVVANHTFLPATKLYLGWGPEDDPEYVYPDRNLFPKGTIKTNLSERFVTFLRFVHDELGGINNNKGARAYVLGFFVHEFTHDLQYMQKPVKDLSSGKPEVVCPEGLCDRTLVAETKLKIAYEDAVFQKQLAVVSDADLEALARDYTAAVARQPARFEKGDLYGLIGPNFAQYYLKALGAIRKAGSISGSAGVVYNGQYRVPELVLELHDVLSQNPADQDAIKKIATEWLSYMAQGSDTEKLRGVSPYLVPVEHRFGVELARAVAMNTPAKKQ